MYNKPTNTFLRTLYSPGFSSLTLSYYLANITLKFIPYIGKDNTGLSKYCDKTFLSISINPDGASFFYMIASKIIDGKELDKPIETVLPCLNGTTLTFEYKPDEKNLMAAYLVIDKNNQTIRFKFPSMEYQDLVDGQLVTKVAQTGLGTFALILGCYLAGKAANNYIAGYSNEVTEQRSLEWHHEEERAKIAAAQKRINDRTQQQAFATVQNNNNHQYTNQN